MSRLPHNADLPGHYTDSLDLHTGTLFDHNGTIHGDYLDPTTGKHIDNSTFLDVDQNGLFDESGRQIGSIIDPAKQRRAKPDAAMEWLAQHDPQHDRSRYL